MKEREPCVCGHDHPWHLADLFDDRCAHICACGRRYKVVDGVFVYDGAERNPLTGREPATA